MQSPNRKNHIEICFRRAWNGILFHHIFWIAKGEHIERFPFLKTCKDCITSVIRELDHLISSKIIPKIHVSFIIKRKRVIRQIGIYIIDNRLVITIYDFQCIHVEIEILFPRIFP